MWSRSTALTIAEIERGVIARERTDPSQGEVLRRWLDQNVLPAFSGRVLPFDLAAARLLAGYRVPEHAPLATRNVRQFARLGVACVDPWTQSGEG